MHYFAPQVFTEPFNTRQITNQITVYIKFYIFRSLLSFLKLLKPHFKNIPHFDKMPACCGSSFIKAAIGYSQILGRQIGWKTR